MAFKEKDRLKALLWSDRHCCLCGRQCGVAIELHHIKPKGRHGPDSFENAIPLCFDCHCSVGHYQDSHSRGLKISEDELVRRREQLYDLHTSKYVPPVTVRLIGYPDIGFEIVHCADNNPAAAFVTILPHGTRNRIASAYYCGKRAWNLNPRTGIFGHFASPFAKTSKAPYRIEIRVTLRDQVGRNHILLPCAYTWDGHSPDWYLEPSPK
jgi:HNH endonuclease